MDGLSLRYASMNGPVIVVVQVGPSRLATAAGLRENDGSPTIVDDSSDMIRIFIREMNNIYACFNKLLLFVIFCYLHIGHGDGYAFEMEGALNWISLTIQAVLIASEVIVSLELFYLSTFRCIKAICGTLGFELLLWSMVSFQNTLIINGVLFTVVVIRSFRRKLLRIQPNDIIHMIDGEPLGAAATASPFDQAGSDPVEDDLV